MSTYLRHAPRYDRQQEQSLFYRLRDGDTEARGLLFRSLAAWAIRRADYWYRTHRKMGDQHTYRVPSLLDDLIQWAFYGLLEAIDRFDPDRNMRLSTYAKWFIDRQCRLCLKRNTLIYVPVNTRFPDRAMVARSVAQLYLTRDCDPDSRGDEIDPGERLHPSIDPQKSKWLDEPLLMAALRSLRPKFLMVLVRYYKGETLTAISHDLDVSRERVRQMREEALKKVRQYYYGATYDQGSNGNGKIKRADSA